MAGLSLLHDEVLLRIFEYVADPRTMASLEGVSRSWRSLVRSSPSNMWRRICLSFGFAVVGPQPLLQLPPFLLGSCEQQQAMALTAGWKVVLRQLLTASIFSTFQTLSMWKAMRADDGGELVVDDLAQGEHAGSCVVQLRDPIYDLGGDRVTKSALPLPWVGQLPPAPTSRKGFMPKRDADAVHFPMLERRFLTPSDGPGRPTTSSSTRSDDAENRPPCSPEDFDYQLQMRNFHYYEVEIRHSLPPPSSSSDGRRGGEAAEAGDEAENCVAIGLAAAHFSTNGSQPGWTRSSWGYHGDDGMIYHTSGEGLSWGPPFQAGDTVGCGLDCCLCSIFYTLNGRFLGVAHQAIPPADYYPVVGVDSSDTVRVNLLGPFQFDLGRYAAMRRACADKWWASEAVVAAAARRSRRDHALQMRHQQGRQRQQHQLPENHHRNTPPEVGQKEMKEEGEWGEGGAAYSLALPAQKKQKVNMQQGLASVEPHSLRGLPGTSAAAASGAAASGAAVDTMSNDRNGEQQQQVRRSAAAAQAATTQEALTTTAHAAAAATIAKKTAAEATRTATATQVAYAVA